MRIYESCREMHNETKRDLHEMGILVHPGTMQDKDVSKDESFTTLELSPFTFTLLSGEDRSDWIDELGMNLKWCHQEIRERWNAFRGYAHNPGTAWKMRSQVWQEFIHGGKFSYTYSERFAFKQALPRIIRILHKLPNTRHGILPVFSADPDLGRIGGKARVPCSMYYQFLIRENELRCIYTMRSSDFFTHFPYDIWLALELQSRVAAEVDLKPGRFTFFTGSLHIYAKDAEAGVF